MNGGDLSLSQALGGLRIANPDDATEAVNPTQGSVTRHEESRQPARASIHGQYDVKKDTKTFSTEPELLGQNRDDQNGDLPKSMLQPASAAALETSAPSAAAGTRYDQGQRDIYRSSQLPPQQLESTGTAGVPPRRSSKAMADRYRSPLQGGGISSSPSETYMPVSSEDWKDRGAAVGIRREVDSTGRMVVRQVKKGVRDFSFGRILGEGSYSTVYLATDRQTLKEYAIKVLEKRHIIKEKKIKYVNIEKNTLNRLTEHPGVVRLYYTFQDETSLYYVLDLCNGGELLGVLKKTGTFDIECARFYGAQILDAVEYMHSRGVIHRDLKPENVLLDDKMHVKITDFGTAKLLPDPREATPPSEAEATDRSNLVSANQEENESDRAASFVGTAEYVSPELLTHKSACKASDLWAFGCIIYQLLAGRPPFKAANEYLTFQKIVNLEYEFPPGFPPSARDLVERCLVLDPDRRLTAEHIKNHEFFEGQHFGKGLWRKKAPRLRPFVPPAQEPNIIQLNGTSRGTGSVSRSRVNGPSTANSYSATSGNNRPGHIITELPPPTQLDIEWSPVLTRNNERILKLGDMMVISSPLPSGLHHKGADDGHKKLSRFFGGSSTKKRQRLVMVTSTGRVILAPAGGEDKRAKQELSLLSSDSSWNTQKDAKGQLVWCIDTGGYRYSFEVPKMVSDTEAERTSAEEWIECLDKARDMALSLNSALGDDGIFGDMSSSVSNFSATLGQNSGYSDGMRINDRPHRSHLSKNHGPQDETAAKRNRFSKRQSRNGLDSAF